MRIGGWGLSEDKTGRGGKEADCLRLESDRSDLVAHGMK